MCGPWEGYLHAGHLDHAAELYFAPTAARGGALQRVNEAGGLRAELLLRQPKRADLLRQRGVRANSRLLDLLHVGVEFCE